MSDKIYNTIEELEEKTKECIGAKIIDFDINGRLKNGKNKGAIGQVMEEGFYGIATNSRQEPDFNNIGVELKVTPYKWVRKNKEVSAKERLVLTDINYMQDINKNFKDSHCYEKLHKIMLLFYEYEKNINDCTISKSFMYNYDNISEEDRAIIEHDYKTIMQKIESGNADKISESDTQYLGACTKGQNAASSKVSQPYSATKAPARAFALKTSYMTQLLRNEVFFKYSDKESFIKDLSLLRKYTIFDIVTNYLSKYEYMSLNEIDNIIEKKIEREKKDYSYLYRYISAMLQTNLKDPNNIDEFTKAGIRVVTVRIMKNGKNKESVSTPTFKIDELIDEEWDDSTLRNYFVNTRFLICVFDEINDVIGDYSFRGSFFWSIDELVLDTIIKDVWQDTKNILRHGVILRPIKYGKKIRIENNLPKMSEKRIIHVRPHTSKSTYKFNDIVIHEEYLAQYGDTLPDGRIITKQCFFINKDYILDLINEHFPKNT